jgi:hypothetical protein
MPTGQLAVYRPRHFGRDMFRSYEFMVGRDKTFQIGNGKSLHIELPAGSYPLQASISWCTSRIHLVDVAEGATTVVVLAPNLSYRREIPFKGSAYAADYIRLSIDKSATP